MHVCSICCEQLSRMRALKRFQLALTFVVSMQVPEGLRLAPVASVDFSVDRLQRVPWEVPTVLGHMALDLELSFPWGPGFFLLGP